MKKPVYLYLSLLLLLAAGIWARFGSEVGTPAHAAVSGSRTLSGAEAELDRSARLFLQNAASSYPALYLHQSPRNPGTQGYSRFLAFCYKVCGYGAVSPLKQIRLIQRVLDLSTGFLLYAAVLLLLGPVSAWGITAIYMLHPAIWMETLSLSADNVIRFVQAGALLCIVLFFGPGRHSLTIGALCGGMLGLGTLVYPALSPVLLLLFGIGGLRCFFTRRYLGPSLTALAVSLLILSAWWLSPYGEPIAQATILARFP